MSADGRPPPLCGASPSPIGCTCSGGSGCVTGATCFGGRCTKVCDPLSGNAGCDTHSVCLQTASIDTGGANLAAGVCTPKCDLLTQCGQSPWPEACGSPNPALPTLGCYGYGGQYRCALSAPNVATSVAVTLTDRTTPSANYENDCAPGFMPMLIVETGSTVATCNGFCAALETDNTAAHVNNGKGDPDAYGKLPTQTGLRTDDATCEVGKKGSEATSVCRFMWAYARDSNGVIPPAFLPYLDTLGICFGRTHYKYDGVNTVPDCATLPPQEAAQFYCQTMAHSMVAPSSIPAGLDGEMMPRGEVPATQHTFR